MAQLQHKENAVTQIEVSQILTDQGFICIMKRLKESLASVV